MPNKKAPSKRRRKVVANVPQRVIAYIRVSTQKQGKSGLGLEGQQEAIRAYLAQTGAKLLATYREVESGKLSDRPELAKALSHARRSKAVLLVAKLDRLARNLHFLTTIMESGAEFIACDNPHANRLTVHILAAVAEAEAKAISERTKAALQAAKARGTKLGASRPECRNLTVAGRKRGAKRSAEVIRQRADQAYEDIRPMIEEWRNEGLPLASIAQRLNDEGHTTRRGKQWNHVQVQRVLSR
jgi:DNA invertase Pin-like site-specific DNA recombinase